MIERKMKRKNFDRYGGFKLDGFKELSKLLKLLEIKVLS